MTVFTQVFFVKHPEVHDIFSAYVTFVCIDKKANPTPIAPMFTRPFTYESLKNTEARKHWKEVERARAAMKKPK